MSSREKSEKMIAAYYDAFNRKEMHKFLDLLDDQVVHEVNQGAVEIGKQNFSKFMEKMNHSYEENVTDVAIMSNADGSRVGVEYIVHGKYLKSDGGGAFPAAHGQTYSIPGGAFFEIKNNKIKRVTNYYNVKKWIEMVK